MNMNEIDQKAISIFFSREFFEKIISAHNNDIKFVHYTSAEAAMNIIKSKEVWLRNTQCMNDYLEIQHGLDCLTKAFKNDEEGQPFQKTLEKLFPGFIKKFTDIFDSWIPAFQENTYIVCLSEHLPDENQFGRLSMWRAYGGELPVALVLNREPLLAQENNIFQLYTYPVSYLDPDKVKQELGRITKRVSSDREFIKKLGEESVINYLFDSFKSIILSTKHPGFKEEREWRVVYNSEHQPSKHIETEVVSINGIPQQIYKIPLAKNIPEEAFKGATILDLIDRIIIGPCNQQNILIKTFEKLLLDAGCENPAEKIEYSGIPLR